MLLVALNKYLAYGEFAQFPRTVSFSIETVFNGIVGVLPLLIGFSIIITVYLYANFRFVSIDVSLFALFYCMFGDTYFDTGQAAAIINPLVGFIFYFMMLNYIIFGVSQVALAMVEEGYLTAKEQSDFDWVAKKSIDDPCKPSDLEEIKKKSLTIPETIKIYNMRKRLDEVDRKAMSVMLDKEPNLVESKEIEEYL